MLSIFVINDSFSLMYTWMIHPTRNVILIIYICNNILFNKTWSKFPAFMLPLRFQISMIFFPKNKNDALYNNIWCEVILANFRITRPEIDIINKYHFWSIICQQLKLMNRRSCFGNIILFYLNDYGNLELFHIQIIINAKEYVQQIC